MVAWDSPQYANAYSACGDADDRALWRRGGGARDRKRLILRFIFSVVVGILATLIYLAAGELAMRAAIHAPFLQDHDFRSDRGGNAVNGYIEYDSVVGWRLKPYYSQDGFHTLAYGIRANSKGQTDVKSGGVLAVGSSFTAGSGVKDEETWPAYLEGLIGRNVNNAGQGAFVVDQIILNAEQMMSLVRPRVLVVDFASNSIIGAKYSWHGWPKPYFTVEQGVLVAHNTPVPRTPALETRDWSVSVKRLFGHFVLADRFMTAFFADAWFSSQNQKFVYVSNDEVAVSCLLLRRLQRETEKAGVRLLVMMQHAGAVITNGPKPTSEVVLVEDCIRQMGIQLVDEFASLKALFDANPEKFRDLYLKQPDGSLGHKSALGNLEVAKLVDAALALPPPPISAPDESPEERIEKEWQSILDINNPLKLFQSSAIATIAAREASDETGGDLIKAVGSNTEHYIAAGIPLGGDRMRFSLEARADTASQLRLQLLKVIDGSPHGVIANFDLRQLTSVPFRVGRGTVIDAGIEPIDDGWSRLWVAVSLPPGTGTGAILVHLADSKGDYNFSPHDEAIGVRRVVIDRLAEMVGSSAVPERAQTNSSGRNLPAK